MAAKRKILTKKILIALGIPLLLYPGFFVASLLGWDWQEGLAKLRQAAKSATFKF